MDDISLEYRVEKNTGGKDRLIKAVCIVGLLILALMSFFIHPFFLLSAIGGGVLCYFFFPRLNVEYEYLYVAGELSIDCIYSKKSRKNLVNYPMNDVLLIAPEGSDELKQYENTNLHRLDLTSRNREADRYVIICRVKGNTDYALTEPGDEIIKAIFNRYPGKCARGMRV